MTAPSLDEWHDAAASGTPQQQVHLGHPGNDIAAMDQLHDYADRKPGYAEDVLHVAS
jgi:hypothetical protein